jgi:hypothetical protein
MFSRVWETRWETKAELDIGKEFSGKLRLIGDSFKLALECISP